MGEWVLVAKTSQSRIWQIKLVETVQNFTKQQRTNITTSEINLHIVIIVIADAPISRSIIQYGVASSLATPISNFSSGKDYVMYQSPQCIFMFIKLSIFQGYLKQYHNAFYSKFQFSWKSFTGHKSIKDVVLWSFAGYTKVYRIFFSISRST